MEKKVRNLIIKKLAVIDEGDINLEGETKDYIKGFKEGLTWLLEA